MYSTKQIELLVDLYTKNRRIKQSTLGRLAVGSSSVFFRIENGTATIRTVKRIIDYLSANWPLNLKWPSDIPRPSSSSKTKKKSA